MEKPMTLKILSIITTFVGCLRVYSGISILSKKWDYLSQSGQIPYIIVINFLEYFSSIYFCKSYLKV